MILNEESPWKTIFIGNSDVGKTSIVRRFVFGDFCRSYNIRGEFNRKEIMVDNSPITLFLWHTTGQERFRALTLGYFRGSDIIIFVFDISQSNTLNDLERLMNDCYTRVPLGTPMFLCGNKIDLAKDPTIDEKLAILRKKFPPLPYFETSAKDDINITTLFEECCKYYLKLPQNIPVNLF